MEISNLKVTLLPHTSFLMEDGTFNLKKAMIYQGQIGGICYNEDGLLASFHEKEESTSKRVERTTSGEHQSVFEHVNIGLYLQNSPKFLNMILNNEHQYATSERSLRYTTIKEDGVITEEMIQLYQKWNNIFFVKIKEKYGSIKSDKQIMKLAQENSRYLMPVTIPTEMVHTIPLAQLNRVINYMIDYKEHGINGKKDDLQEQLLPHIEKLIEELYRVNVIDERLLSNRKHRKLSIFGEHLSENNKEYGEVYSTIYQGSYAELAQAHRHRTIYYKMERNKNKEYFIPPIILEDPLLVDEWLNDTRTLIEKYQCIPQNEKVTISEQGTFDNFVMKMKERLCSAAQLEVAMQTEATRDEYYQALVEEDHPKKKEMESYMHGARCTFHDYDCPKSCNFNDGIKLLRKI